MILTVAARALEPIIEARWLDMQAIRFSDAATLLVLPRGQATLPLRYGQSLERLDCWH